MSNFKKWSLRAVAAGLGVAVMFGLAPDAEAANGLRRVALRANGL